MKRVMAVLVSLAACGNQRQDASESPPPSAPVPVESQATKASRVLPAISDAPLGWRWNHELHEAREGEPVRMQRQKDRIFELDGGWNPDLLSLSRRDDSGKVHWKVDIDPKFGATGALALHQGWALVVRHSAIASGAELLVFDQETGRELHKSALHGLGEVAHSKYRNEVQLQIQDDKLVVFGKESQGKYVEVYESGSWKRLSNTKVDEELAAIEWQWSGPARASFHEGPSALKVGDISYTYKDSESSPLATLSKQEKTTGEKWSTTLAGQRSCGTASMLEHQGLLFVVHYCSIASGSQLKIYDAETGTLQSQRAVVGIGARSHSEYWNDVELKLLHGHVVIFGREAQGRYIEVIDASSGRLVTLQTLEP